MRMRYEKGKKYEIVASGLLSYGLFEEDSKRLVAHFPRTISVYEGSEVRVLGVPIGNVESVEPSGTDVVSQSRIGSASPDCSACQAVSPSRR